MGHSARGVPPLPPYMLSSPSGRNNEGCSRPFRNFNVKLSRPNFTVYKLYTQVEVLSKQRLR